MKSGSTPLNLLPPVLFHVTQFQITEEETAFLSLLNSIRPIAFSARLSDVRVARQISLSGSLNFLRCLCACVLPRRKRSVPSLLRVRRK